MVILAIRLSVEDDGEDNNDDNEEELLVFRLSQIRGHMDSIITHIEIHNTPTLQFWKCWRIMNISPSLDL